MRLVIDTNVMVSALLGSESSLPAQLIDIWRRGGFELFTSTHQLEELKRVTRYPKLRVRLPPVLAGRLINDLRTVAAVLDMLPSVCVCADPHDDHLLATAQAAGAAFVVTGDKRDLLTLGWHEATRIVAVRDFLVLIRRLP